MLKGLFGGGSGEQEVLKEPDAESTTQEGEAQRATSSTKEKEKKTNGQKKDMSTIPLEVNVVFSSLPPMSVAEKRASRDRSVHSFSKNFVAC